MLRGLLTKRHPGFGVGTSMGVLAADGRIAPWGPHVGPRTTTCQVSLSGPPRRASTRRPVHLNTPTAGRGAGRFKTSHLSLDAPGQQCQPTLQKAPFSTRNGQRSGHSDKSSRTTNDPRAQDPGPKPHRSAGGTTADSTLNGSPGRRDRLNHRQLHLNCTEVTVSFPMRLPRRSRTPPEISM